MTSQWLKGLVIVGIVVGVGGMSFLLHTATTTNRVHEMPLEVSTQRQAQDFEQPTLWIHIAGAVYRPGVYAATPNQRVKDVLCLAGGVRPDADLDKTNLVAKIKDGQRILIRSTLSKQKSLKWVGRRSDVQASGGAKWTLQTASMDQLVSLPGVGPVMAHNIMELRSKVAITPDTLRQIRGISDKKIHQFQELGVLSK